MNTKGMNAKGIVSKRRELRRQRCDNRDAEGDEDEWGMVGHFPLQSTIVGKLS